MSPVPPSEGACGKDEYERGVELYRQGRFDEAAKCFAELRDRGGVAGTVARFYQGMAHRAIGVAALKQGRFDVAEQHLLSAAKAAGPDADLAKYLASTYAQTGRNQQCVNQMEKVVSRQVTPKTSRRLAQAQWQAGRQEQALMTLTTALRRFGSAAELHLQMGLFAAAVEKLDDARTSFLKAIEADCDSCDAYYYLGLTCSAAGDMPAAVRAFQRAFDLQPDNLLLAHQLAMAARAASDNGYNVVLHLPESRQQEAASEIRHMAAYVVGEPDFVESFLSLPPSDIDAELFGTLGNIVRMALADHPDFADLRLYCSRICDRLGEAEAAIEQAEAALAINPDYVQVLIHLGRLLAGAGQPRIAIERLIHATRCGGDWADVHFLIGELMISTGSRVRAAEHFRRALELNPTYRPAMEAASKIAA